jgi:ribosome maturation factor RimP
MRQRGGSLPEVSEATAPAPAASGGGKAAAIERLIAPSAEAMGFRVVRVLLTGNRRARLQIMAERADGSGMIVDDCASLSRAVSAILDVEDPIAGSYELEVSSPGIDRPLTRLADFERFAGFEAKVESSVADADGRRRWVGRLLGLDGETVRLATEDGDVAVPFANLTKAKLVLTDALIAAAQEGRYPANREPENGKPENGKPENGKIE